MQISRFGQSDPSGRVHPSSAVAGPHAGKAKPSAATRTSATDFPADRVEISDVARFTLQAKLLPEIRADRVASIRAQIEAGTYETPEKLELAAQRLLGELG